MASVITESTGGKSAAELRVVFLLYESHQSMVVARGLIHEHGIVPRLMVNSSVVDPRRRRLRLLRFLAHPARRRIAVWKVVEVVAGRVASRIGAARHGHAPSAKRLAEEFTIAYERCSDINAAVFQERLRSIDADLLVCIHFNQILKPSMRRRRDSVRSTSTAPCCRATAGCFHISMRSATATTLLA